MRLKYTFEMVDMGDEIIAVPVGEKAEELSGILKLNKEGWKIMELLSIETTENEIIDSLEKEYDTNRDILTKYVNRFVEALDKNGIIDS